MRNLKSTITLMINEHKNEINDRKRAAKKIDLRGILEETELGASGEDINQVLMVNKKK